MSARLILTTWSTVIIVNISISIAFSNVLKWWITQCTSSNWSMKERRRLLRGHTVSERRWCREQKSEPLPWNPRFGHCCLLGMNFEQKRLSVLVTFLLLIPKPQTFINTHNFTCLYSQGETPTRVPHSPSYPRIHGTLLGVYYFLQLFRCYERPNL